MNGSNAGSPQFYTSGVYLSSALASEVRWMGETCTHFLATGKTTNGQFCLVEETSKRGEAVPLHRHEKDVESFYVLEGEITFYVGDQAGIRCGPGSFLHVPAGVVHGFRISSDTARYLIFTTAHHGEFYRAISEPADANGLPSTHDVDWDKVMATAQDFGIEFISELPDG
ncbi:quercetin 2,3-dioxygenase [Nitratireductor pacificus]|uniref:Cupin n=1 Tax=Nitratireductor pacificus pht-3B TaxID=391937 RepID=K2MDJ2_9HYPH|nr:quercetin 2,3-dioxygenase [Nitratireductor pacificus]EKF20246.1 cupin [Nitratireductor pacificus pht-3B]